MEKSDLKQLANSLYTAICYDNNHCVVVNGIGVSVAHAKGMIALAEAMIGGSVTLSVEEFSLTGERTVLFTNAPEGTPSDAPTADPAEPPQ